MLVGRTAGQASSGTQIVSAFLNSTSCCGFSIVAFGPAKFALRGLAQSLARALGPKGIHAAWINVDGVIDIPRTRERFPQFKDEDLLKPDAIAETYWHLAHQDRSAWTLELEVRPFEEKF